ncbi:MAG TPA: hypothetical protein DCM28_18135 [Phycisphaerales bacterium]|nr:hypothetical protein [Phycisphaerales bacterium]HCD34942.1 hypothetical protein [Phycisphaerales bacterium]|tara:strand:+ start:2220 stop:2471 length:252 start_codon:yes stop_codon:yes gene_type:complete
MSQPNVRVSLIIGITLIACTLIAGNALMKFGKSLEKAASNSRPPSLSIPSHMTIRTPDLPNTLNLGIRNEGGRLTIETITKSE